MKWFKSIHQKLISTLLLIIFIANPIGAAAQVLVNTDLDNSIQTYVSEVPETSTAKCKELSKVCVEGPSYKTINGVSVYRACWNYQYQFNCIDPNAADYCEPLKRPDCEVQGQECLEKTEDGVCMRYNHKYSCDVDIAKELGSLPENIEELEPTHLITQEWVSPECDAATAGFSKCSVLSEKCLDGPEEREINGVKVYRECWRKEVQKQCLAEVDNRCTEYENDPTCTIKTRQCISELPDGTCQIWDNVYQCVEAGYEIEQSNCKDGDFAEAMTSMEMLRELSRYYDIGSQTFFKGDASFCSVKLGGAFDGVFGGDCCKSQGDPAEFKDWAVQAGTNMAINYGVASLGSAYTYSVLAVNGPEWIATGVQAAEGFASMFSAGTSGGGAPAISFYGFGLSTTPAVGGSIGVGSMAAGSNTVYLTFNPMAFAIAIAIMALTQWLECGNDEVITVFRREAGLCHHVGSYCAKEVLGACVQKRESYCCYISKLAKIINVQGKKQLGMGFGTPEEPQCDGFLAQDLERLDFSKMDLSEFYEEIRASMPNTADMMNRVNESAEKLKDEYENNQPKGYYDE
ncbi:conjugal transfer protein TraN [Neisseria sp. Ec49-e6-T10]|uniref:conjugal transfer protein TraN n=1 Tax=Neisseria sp. Ec49-e6-T10 TaxID=3140744 RepID=UPI003EBDCF6E